MHRPIDRCVLRSTGIEAVFESLISVSLSELAKEVEASLSPIIAVQMRVFLQFLHFTFISAVGWIKICKLGIRAWLHWYVVFCE